MTLNEKIDRYESIQTQMDSLKQELDALKESILSEMDSENIESKETQLGNIAKVVEKTNFKYIDELSMIKFLKDNGYGLFVKEAVNTTALNSELKKKTVLAESLSSYYTKSNTRALTVKGKVL